MIPQLLPKSLRTSWQGAPPELRRRAIQVIGGAAAVFILVSGYRYAMYKREQAARARELAAGPRVRTAHVVKGRGEHVTTVIGETRPYESATLYAKVSGYLRKVVVDKGDVVKEGQLLAVIESPETDEAYLAAAADARNKTAIAARIAQLFAKQLVSPQESDQARADAEVASARLRTQQTLKNYESLRAPFAGTVTARYADPGALVQNATNSETSALPVVMVSQIRRLRVDVFIDQRDAPFVAKDEPVQISLQERPELKIEGRVDRVSGELDPRTKMLLTEIDIPNEDGNLVAGSFVQVSLEIKAPPYLEAPVEALALKGGKSYLTAITPGNHLAFREVQIADNDGKLLTLISGVSEGDTLALNVGDSLPDGALVRPITGDQKE